MSDITIMEDNLLVIKDVDSVIVRENETDTVEVSSSFTVLASNEQIDIISEGIQGPVGAAGSETIQDSTLTYASGLLTKIDYADGSYKTLSYNVDDRLSSTTYYRIDGSEVLKNFSYNPEGNLISVEVEIS